MGRASLVWTDEMLAALGSDKDAVLAERWGTSAKTVNLKRNSLGIAAFGHVDWTPEMLAALGQESDASLATAGASARPVWWPSAEPWALRRRTAAGANTPSTAGSPTRCCCWVRHRMPMWPRSWG